MITIRFIKILYSSEFLFVLFLFAGAFKESLNFPIDLAVFSLALLLLKILLQKTKNFKFKKTWQTHFFLAFSLILIILLGLLFNGISNNTVGKIMRLVTFTLPTFFLPILFLKDREDLKRLILSLGILSIILSLFIIPSILNSEVMFIGFNGGNYLGLARVTGSGLIALVYFFIEGNKGDKLLSLLAILLVSFTLFSTGSRMPIAALILITVYALFYSFRFENKSLLIKKKSLSTIRIGTLVILAIPYFYSKGYFQTIFYRFEVLFSSGGGGASTQGRLERFEAAMMMFNDNFLVGGGFGNFGDYYYQLDGVYAHNIFLEFLSEMGVLGFLWISIFSITIIYKSIILFVAKYGSIDNLQLTLIASFLYFMLNAMVSGDINSNRAVFAFASILLLTPVLSNKKAINNSL